MYIIFQHWEMKFLSVYSETRIKDHGLGRLGKMKKYWKNSHFILNLFKFFFSFCCCLFSLVSSLLFVLFYLLYFYFYFLF